MVFRRQRCRLWASSAVRPGCEFQRRLAAIPLALSLTRFCVSCAFLRPNPVCFCSDSERSAVRLGCGLQRRLAAVHALPRFISPAEFCPCPLRHSLSEGGSRLIPFSSLFPPFAPVQVFPGRLWLVQAHAIQLCRRGALTLVEVLRGGRLESLWHSRQECLRYVGFVRLLPLFI
jgi:hypothetical protein